MPLDCVPTPPGTDGDVRGTLAWPAIHLAEELISSANHAQTCRDECQRELTPRLQRVAVLLRRVAVWRDELYERPARRILTDSRKAIDAAGAVIDRCRGGGFVWGRVVCAVTPAAGSFRKTAILLDAAVADLTWLLRISDVAAAVAEAHDGGPIMDLPTVAKTDPILYLVWTQISVLRTGDLSDRAGAAASIASFARDDNGRYGWAVVEEDGVPALLRLIKEGDADAKESATLAISLIVRHRP